MKSKEFMLIKNRLENEMRSLAKTIEMARELVEKPDKLEPLTAECVQIGTVVWMQDCSSRWVWAIIEDIYNISSWDRGFCCDDGCRYGLDESFIEASE